MVDAWGGEAARTIDLIQQQTAPTIKRAVSRANNSAK
jgi:hypothetical protein